MSIQAPPATVVVPHHRSPDPRRRPIAYIPWRLCMWLVALGVLWDAAGMLGAAHSSAYNGPSYSVLRLAPGGMRVYGVILGALILVTVWAYGRSTSAHDGILKGCLSLLGGWYVMWTGALITGWLHAGSWAGVGGLGRTIAFAVMCGYVAYFAPRR